MADSLDDFFAKKDKKRKDKSKSSAISAVALVKELEEGAKQAEFQVRKEGKTSAALELLGLDLNDSDWKDFEEVEKRDYTGLKVKEMSIQDQEEDNRRQIERAEQAPEVTPWKSKEATVAAITSAHVDSTLAMEQQLTKQLDEDKNSEASASTSDIKKDDKKSEVNSDGTEAANKNSESQKPNLVEKLTNTIAADSVKIETDIKKSETTTGATKPAVYRPRAEREEAITLERVKMSSMIRPGSGSSIGRVGDLSSQNEYPSLA